MKREKEVNHGDMDENTQYKLLINQDSDTVATIAAEILMNDNISSYEMIEDLAYQYYGQTEDFYKKGMNYVSSAIFGYDIPDLIKHINQKIADQE